MENDLKEFKKEQIYLGAEVSEEPQIIMQEGAGIFGGAEFWRGPREFWRSR